MFPKVQFKSRTKAGGLASQNVSGMNSANGPPNQKRSSNSQTSEGETPAPGGFPLDPVQQAATEPTDESRREDPMLDRLWSMKTYRESGRHRDDPMINRLWAATRYRDDPMLDRLWKATRYREDPMLDRLWAFIRYRDDSMLDRLWNGEKYVSETYCEPASNDPMISRLWNGEKYGSQVYLHTATVVDTMIDRLWNGERYTEEFRAPASEKIQRTILSQDDPTLSRLSNWDRYRDDPMLSRLWNGDKYGSELRRSSSDDPMINRLWNGDRYESKSHTSELHAPNLVPEVPLTPVNKLHLQFPKNASTSEISHLGLEELPNTSGDTNNPFEDKEYEFEDARDSFGDSNLSSMPASYVAARSGQYPDPGLPTTAKATSGLLDYSQDDETDSIQLPQRHSGLFTSIVDAFRADIPLASQFRRSQVYTSVPADDDFDSYGQRPLDYYTPMGRYAHFEEPLPENPYQDYESERGLPLRIDSTVRTYPHSDVDSSPATPSNGPSSPFQEIVHEPAIQESWSPPREELQEHRELKPQASPPRRDFNTYHPQSYPSYIPPKSNLAHQSTEESPASLRSSHDGTSPSPLPTLPRSTFGSRSNHTMTQSPSSLFQKTRGLFESITTKPPSSLPRPALLDGEEIVPRSLDSDPKPPSPAFALPALAR